MGFASSGRARHPRPARGSAPARWPRALAAAAAIGLVATLAGAAVAQGPPLRLEPVLSGLLSPLFVTHAGDGSYRLFALERGGRILLLRPGESAPRLFLDLTSRVLAGGERGLLGLAFHPRYRETGRLFVHYTRQPDGASVIAEYRVTPDDPDRADPAETVLLTVPQPFGNHNGGSVEFGPDGFLYVALGDGGDANDPGNRAQDPDELLGKILRIDVDRADPPRPYAIPPDNPYAAGGGRPEVYALGFRNPYRIAFDPVTGVLFAGDTGQDVREEIDVVTRGGNYGWRVFEGTRCTGNDPALCDPTRFVMPVAEYDRTAPRCAVIGGVVYRGARETLPAGAYVFGDFCSGQIFRLAGPGPVLLLDTDLLISSFGTDEAGEVYVVDFRGAIFRLTATLPFTLSPPSGTYLTTQAFDLVLVVRDPARLVSGTATFDGRDVSGPLTACLRAGRVADGAATFRCPGVTGQALGPGVHVLAVTLRFDDGSASTARVVWEVLAVTEP